MVITLKNQENKKNLTKPVFIGFARPFNQQGMRESNPVGTPHNPHKISISSIEF